MVIKKKFKNIGHWRSIEGGYEKTNSAKIIAKTLARLKEKRIFVILFHKGYQSGNTILFGVGKESLLIDKPLDWPGVSSRVRVVFRDESKVWNHFTVKVVEAPKDTLKSSIPTELFRLQRRRHYRISVPSESYASFLRKSELFGRAEVVNISVGGVLLSLNEKNPIVDQGSDDSIENVCIQVGGVSEAARLEQDDPITVCKGRIAREFIDKQNRRLMAGVELFPQMKEEKELFKYVRWRELEMLRKGIKD